MEELISLTKQFGLPIVIMGIIIYRGFKEYLIEKNYNRERDKEDMQVITELNVFVKEVVTELKDIKILLLEIKNNQNAHNN